MAQRRAPSPQPRPRPRRRPTLGRQVLIAIANLLAIAIAPLLLLLVAAAAALFARALRHPAGPGSLAWFGLGLAAWLAGAALAPLPVRLYVLGHELTHLLWARLLGQRASLPRVHGRGGSITVSTTNVWISLAPYFYPFYVALVVAGWELAGIWLDLARFRPLALLAAGAALALHWTFTLLCLAQRQTDLAPHGRAFSLVLIAAANLLLTLVLTVWVVPGLNLADAGLTCAQVAGCAANLLAPVWRKLGAPGAAR